MHCTTISLQMRIGASGKTRQNRSKNHFGRFVREQWEVEWIEIGPLWVHGGKTSPLIQQYVLPGTTIVSDCWRAYRTIGLLGKQQLNFVDPNLDVVDPITGASTNHVEFYWKNAKMCDCGTVKLQLQSYLIEYMWRRQFGDNP